MISRGDIWYYPYLWKREKKKGESEGRKPRETVCIVKTKNEAGVHQLILVAITSVPPRGDEIGVEIPILECRRSGLDTHKPLWAIVSEYNFDIAEKSFYLDPKGRVGEFSQSFTVTITNHLIQNIRAKRVSKVSRNP